MSGYVRARVRTALRSAPSTQADRVVTMLEAHEQAGIVEERVTATGEQWYRVTRGPHTGWVRGLYVTRERG
jgi:hypothetical protein